MRVANSTDILQHKMNNLFHVFEFICAYMDELLVLSKVDCTDYVQKIKLPVNKPKEKVIKCNIEKSFFGKTKM